MTGTDAATTFVSEAAERGARARFAGRAGSGAVSTCSVCGCVAADRDVEDTNGWRWYSDGRGGLRSLCATCPVPSSLPAHS